MRVPLVEGEEPTPLVRVMAAADSGNGVSATLDWNEWLFINTDLTVHLHRMPEGEWVCLDAVTIPEPNGIGMADTRLSDERGADRARRAEPAGGPALAGREADRAGDARCRPGRSSRSGTLARYCWW